MGIRQDKLFKCKRKYNIKTDIEQRILIKDARYVSLSLIIGHKSCNMLIILNKLTLKNVVSNNVLLENKVKSKNTCATTTKKTKSQT